jgi:hypothetical protein
MWHEVLDGKSITVAGHALPVWQPTTATATAAAAAAVEARGT